MAKDVLNSGTADSRRQVIRLGGDFLLKSTGLLARALDTDLTSATLFATIGRMNVAELSVQAEASGQFPDLNTAPSADELRPVSVYALSREVRLPYETTRRYSTKLAAAGLCVRWPDGMVVPPDVYLRPVLVDLVEAVWDLTRAYLDDLAASGVRIAPAEIASPADLRRQVTRHARLHILNSIRLLTETLRVEAVEGLVMLAMIRANTWALTVDPALAADFAGLNQIPLDDLRRPVSVYALARDLRLPYETTRRYVNRFEEAGLCERRPAGGFVVPAKTLAAPAMIEAVDAYWRETNRFLSALAALGVAGQAK